MVPQSTILVPQARLSCLSQFSTLCGSRVLVGGRGVSQKLSVVGQFKEGLGTKLFVSATRLNSKEAHKVTHGHNAHCKEDTITKEDNTIIMEWTSPPFSKLQLSFWKIK